MKIKNLEKFRTTLFKNVKDLYFSGCDICELLKTEIEPNKVRPENKEGAFIRVLHNPLQIRKYHYNTQFGQVTDDQLFMKVYEDSIVFFRYDPETQSYKWITDIDYEYQPNQTVLMMEVAIKIAEFCNR